MIDCDYYVGQPLDSTEWPDMKGSREGPAPIVRIFGVTESGQSVLVHAHCFTPYFYVQAPPGFVEADCGLFRSALNTAVINSNPSGLRDVKELVHHVQVCGTLCVWSVCLVVCFRLTLAG